MINKKLKKLLSEKMSITRLTKTGLFKRIPYERSPEVDLFRAVLDKALIDYFNPNEETQKEVSDWLSLENEAFVTVCEYALLDPPDVFYIFNLLKNEILKGEKSKLLVFKKRKRQ